MMEEWRAVPGYVGRYEVSSEGRVRSVDRWHTHASGSSFLRKGRVLTPCPGTRGYLQVTLTGEGRWATKLVHRLVASAFLGPANGLHVRHLDGVKAHNQKNNLKYGTPQENSDDQKTHGTVRLGSDHPRAKLTEVDVLAIRASSKDGVSVAAQFGVSKQLISRIRARGIWTHI